VTAQRLRRLLLGLFACGLFITAWAVCFEPGRLVVRESELALPRWPKELSGLKVALLSDLHIGSPHWDIAALARLVERTNAQKPDLVLLAGDYQINDVVGGVFVEAEPIAQGLAGLKARLGVIAVLGNHDWWNDGERTRRAFQAQGIMAPLFLTALPNRSS
jgi:predicted MPP superfamily phosphohydrolase